jgi:hypothetical protein
MAWKVENLKDIQFVHYKKMKTTSWIFTAFSFEGNLGIKKWNLALFYC